MKDQFGREIDYIRISVTDRCNLRCVYCMPEQGVPSIPHDDILRFSEIVRVCRAAAGLGIRKIKLTGGEPLVRRGIVSLVKELKQTEGIEQVTLTTNGLLLGDFYDDLADAGLDSLTVSLDTMNPRRYCRITRRDELETVRGNLFLAVEKERIPLKINCVPLTETPAEELAEIAALARDHEVHVRFIEMMPIGPGEGFPCVTEEELIRKLTPFLGQTEPWEGELGNGPARYYQVRNYRGKIGFISALSHRFCGSCNRIRLTSDGFLKCCLQYETGVDLKPVLRGECPRNLADVISEGIQKKPAGHCFGEDRELPGADARKMSQIGG